MRLLHVINSLGTGGAEAMLVKLVSRMNTEGVRSSVITLMDRGRMDGHLETLGIPVVNVGLRRGQVPMPIHLVRFARAVKQLEPDIIQGWMYHGNLACIFGALFVKGLPVVWNIRHSIYDLKHEKRMTATLIRMGATLSRMAARIIYNSAVSKEQHEALGYQARSSLVVHNGFDCATYCPDPDARRSVRQELGVPMDAMIVGLIARYHPMKDHSAFLTAAASIARTEPNVHFILVGSDVSTEQQRLNSEIERLDLAERVHLLGERMDIPRITASMDVATLCSAWGEGFPNVVGEAMACGVPCVVTDVGESARIVGDTGIVVPSRTPEALARAWKDILELPEEKRRELGEHARKRIMENFSLHKIVSDYEALYREILDEHRSEARK